MRTVRPMIIVSVAAAVLAACTGSEPDAVPPTSPATPNPTPATPPPASPTESPAPVVGLEDGRHFGYVKSVDVEGSTATLVFDLAEFLTGEAANEAAREDGVLGEDESLPNDYYIRNRNPQLRTLAMDQQVRITVVDWDHCCDTIDGELAPFAAAFEEEDPTGTYRGSSSPYWLEVARGRVVSIEEQYLP